MRPNTRTRIKLVSSAALFAASIASVDYALAETGEEEDCCSTYTLERPDDTSVTVRHCVDPCGEGETCERTSGVKDGQPWARAKCV